MHISMKVLKKYLKAYLYIYLKQNFKTSFFLTKRKSVKLNNTFNSSNCSVFVNIYIYKAIN